MTIDLGNWLRRLSAVAATLSGTAIAGGSAIAQPVQPSPSLDPYYTSMRYVRPTYYLYGMAGGSIYNSTDFTQTAGLFTGRADGGSGFAGGLSAEATLWRFGMPTHETFGTFDLQARLNIDYTSGRRQSVYNSAGSLSGNLDSSAVNFLIGPQIRTPIESRPRISSIDAYAGVMGGFTRVNTSSTPTGSVNFDQTDTTWAVRFVAGLDGGLGAQFRAGLEYSYQITGATEYSTNFAGERFRLSSFGSSQIMLRVGFALGGDYRPYTRMRTTNDDTWLWTRERWLQQHPDVHLPPPPPPPPP